QEPSRFRLGAGAHISKAWITSLPPVSMAVARTRMSGFGGKADVLCSVRVFPLPTPQIVQLLILQQRSCSAPLSTHQFKPIRCELLSQGAIMRRREFLGVLGGTAVVWPLAARAQQPMPVIGYVHVATPAATAQNLVAFRRALSEAGFVEGQNVAIEYRYAEGQFDRLPALAAELVNRRVN